MSAERNSPKQRFMGKEYRKEQIMSTIWTLNFRHIFLSNMKEIQSILFLGTF